MGMLAALAASTASSCRFLYVLNSSTRRWKYGWACWRRSAKSASPFTSKPCMAAAAASAIALCHSVDRIELQQGCMQLHQSCAFH